MLQHNHVSCFLCSAVFRLLKTAAPYSKRAAFIRRPFSIKFDLLYSGFSYDQVSSEAMWQTADQCKQGLMGVYASLKEDDLFGKMFLIEIGRAHV